MLPWKRHYFRPKEAVVPPPPPETAYRYFRITVSSNFGLSSSSIGEAYILSGETGYPTAAMSTNTTPEPLVATASMLENLAYRAFDKAANTLWATSGTVTGWVQIDLGAGNEIVPTGLRLVFATANAGNARIGKLQASNNGTDWVDILSYNRGTAGNSVLDQTFNV